jgi:hypothetical protein
MAGRGRVRIALGAVPALLLAGYAVPRWVVGSGLGRYAADPAAAAVASTAYEQVRALNDNPIGRVLFPGARVRRVWRAPGHCRASEPGGRRPHADYRAEVRMVGWFGVPGPAVDVTCGGWGAVLRRRAAERGAAADEAITHQVSPEPPAYSKPPSACALGSRPCS